MEKLPKKGCKNFYYVIHFPTDVKILTDVCFLKKMNRIKKIKYYDKYHIV